MTSMGIVMRKKSLLSNSSETHLNGIPLKICDKTSTLCRGRKIVKGVAKNKQGVASASQLVFIAILNE